MIVFFIDEKEQSFVLTNGQGAFILNLGTVKNGNEIEYSEMVAICHRLAEEQRYMQHRDNVIRTGHWLVELSAMAERARGSSIFFERKQK